jgi:hypothetical protein
LRNISEDKNCGLYLSAYCVFVANFKIDWRHTLLIIERNMAKYKLLTKEELAEFEKEFIEYLVINGIDAERWQSIKSEEAEVAEGIIAAFSDVVYEKIMIRTQYIINAVNNVLFCFYYGKQAAEMIILSYKAEEKLKLDDKDDVMNKLQNDPQVFDISIQEKRYQQARNTELFQMLESGCVVDDGTLFNRLKLYLATRTN